MIRTLHSATLASALAVFVAPLRAAAATPPAPTTPSVDAHAESRSATAVEAVRVAGDLRAKGDYAEAVAQLDVASNLEPTWTEPVRLRAEIFAMLAKKYHPSEAFNAARAVEIERLVELEPSTEVDARKQEIARLRNEAKDAQRIEQRRRELVTPSIILGSLALGTLLAGVLLHSMKPRELLQPTAYRQYRRDRAGIALMSMGGLLVIPAVAMGVLAGRQARNDRHTADFEAETGRRHSVISFAPHFLRGGGGAGLHLRF